MAVKSKNYIAEILAIIVGASFALYQYMDSLDGVIYVGGKINKAIYETENPREFWSTVISSMSIGAIIAGCGLLMLFLNTQHNEEQKKQNPDNQSERQG